MRKHFLPVLLLLLCLAAPDALAKGVTCDFYDIPELPYGWEVSMAPGFNNEEKRSLGHYFNKEHNCSVLIQIAETDAGLDLESLARQTVVNLQTTACIVLSGPEHVGPLMRVEATLTGIPALIYIGLHEDLMCMTVMTGSREECRYFLGTLRNADPTLIPEPELVTP